MLYIVIAIGVFFIGSLITECIINGNWFRKLLAMTIKPGKEKSIKNVLKRALKMYLNGNYSGLCSCIKDALLIYGYTPYCYLIDIEDYIPEYTRENAVKLFDANNDRLKVYWWPICEWYPRYKFMKWLIKQY